ncbi:MAG: hypothetical protein K8R34_02250 [Methanosarcinales archaeon]|nr:hypothetical protein [Methanosarcinales archaeon]
MNPLLKIAVYVMVLSFVIGVGAFIIPLMLDPFENQHVYASEVTELEDGFLLEYELPNSSSEFSGARLFVYSYNKTVNAYYLHDGVQEPLTTGEPYEIRILSGNQSDHEDIGTAWCYLFDATDAVVDSYDGGRITLMVEMNKSALLQPYTETQTDGESYPDMSFTYWKPSTSLYTSLVSLSMSLFILSAIMTLVLAVLMRKYPDSQK